MVPFLQCLCNNLLLFHFNSIIFFVFHIPPTKCRPIDVNGGNNNISILLPLNLKQKFCMEETRMHVHRLSKDMFGA
jgi:hypothetical protein